MKIHELKTDPVVFDLVARRAKTFEIRKNDRDFLPGDLLHLRETTATGEEMKAGALCIYTGDSVVAQVLHVMTGPIYGLQDGWCIMSIEVLSTPLDICPGANEI